MKFTPDGEDQDDLVAFGRIVLLWGQIEAILAGFSLAVNNPRLGLKHRDVAHTFQRKKKRIIEAACELNGLATIRAELKAEMDILEQLHEKRSWIVHGSYQGFTGNECYMFSIYETRDGHKKRWWFPTFTPDEIQALTNDMRLHKNKIEDLVSNALRLMHVKTISTGGR